MNQTSDHVEERNKIRNERKKEKDFKSETK